MSKIAYYLRPVPHETRALRSICVLLCFSGLAAACDSVIEPALRSVVEVSGSNQVAGSGTALTHFVVVRVLENDRPLPGAEVRWRPIAGGGSVDQTVTLSDSLGNAAVRWTLGNDPGQNLLLATSGNASLSIRATGVFQIASVTVGFRHVCALSNTGVAYCWGSNSQGQLGDNTEATRANPVRVAFDIRFKQITAGWSHTCGLSRFDETFCWGDNAVGQLGLPSAVRRRHAPAAVPGADSLIDLSAGFVHTCGVTKAGISRCWGEAAQGQLGSAPVPGLQKISAGEFHTCAVRTDNTGLCWGWNSSGELGTNAPFDAVVPTPTQTFGSTRFTSVAAGVRHTCAIGTDARVYCWGRNAVGETGQDPQVHARVPMPVLGADNFAEIGTGNVHTCGLSGQRAYCWGALLGNGTTASSKAPVLVSSALNFTALSVGFDRTCGVADGEIWCWGPEALSPVRVVFP